MSAPSRVRTTPRRVRRILAWAIAVVVVLVGAAAALAALACSVAARTTAGQVDFSRPLAIPPLAESTVDADGRRVFDLRLQTGRTDFGLGRPTDYLGGERPLSRSHAAGAARRAGSRPRHQRRR